MLLRDGQLPREMDVNSARGINLSMLVLNMLSCMSNNQPMSDLTPLSELINQPMEAANHFLPTMADNQYEIYANQFRNTMVGQNVTIFRKLTIPTNHTMVRILWYGYCGTDTMVRILWYGYYGTDTQW